MKNYLIVGGTPEDYGWQIWMEMPLGGYSGGGWNTYTTYYDVDGELVEYHKWNAENHSTDGNPLPSELVPDTVIVNKPLVRCRRRPAWPLGLTSFLFS